MVVVVIVIVIAPWRWPRSRLGNDIVELIDTDRAVTHVPGLVKGDGVFEYSVPFN
mgnify:CR=1 FL=1